MSPPPEVPPPEPRPGTSAADAETVKRYWYPDRRYDLEEVRKGYGFTAFGLRFGVLAPVLVAVIVAAFLSNSFLRGGILAVWHELRKHHYVGVDVQLAGLVAFFGAVAMLIYLVSQYIARKRKPVYLIDFAVLHLPDELKMSRERFHEVSIRSGFFNEESLAFQDKLSARSGLGDETYLPPPMYENPPRDFTMKRAREEAFSTISGCCDELFRKTGISSQDIDFVIVNCSLFCPTPSLSAMIINKYKMRPDVKNYNLGGMGCSAGIVSIDLARDLLATYPNKIALVFSTENITMNWYQGDVKSMLLSNVLFRVGGAAVLLTNKPSWRSRSKYELLTTVRVITAADDMAHQAIYQLEDDRGKRGVRISRDLVKVVGQALKSNLTMLGPQVLPWSEQIKFFFNLCRRRLSKSYRRAHPPYTPNFKKAFQHFCIHAGGRAIIDGIEQNLQLTPEDVMPSRATLYRYGNTSSSSVWYELNYIECKGNMHKGDRIWQIAFGSGLKCNSAVWKALRTFKAKPDELPESFSS